MKFVHNAIALVLSVSNVGLLTQAVDQGDSGLISRELTDVEYPEFRFTNWDTIDSNTKEAAEILGYDIGTWDKPGTAQIEMERWDELSISQKLSAEGMGFTKKQWDCYQNHYSSYTWDEMRNLKLSEYLIRLGWTRESWDEKIFDKPNSQMADVEWKVLTSNQQIAARELCYFQETWNDVDFEEWECRRDHYRDYTWDELKLDGIDQLFIVLGWNEEMWAGTQGPPPSEGMDWEELTTEEHIAARKLCYLKEEWNGPPYPTFRYRAWEYLTDEQKSNAQGLGYSQMTWNTLGTEEIEVLAFEDLTDSQKEDATALGYDDKVWDCYINHYEGYFWYELQVEGVQHWMVVLGWDSSNWNDGSAPNSEITVWENLSVAQKTAAKELCYIEESWNAISLDEWDCAKDNFMDRSWEELKTIGVQQYFLTLGWTKASWEAGEPPAADAKDWNELTTDEADAARAICFEKENWDGAETFYPAKRYHVWDLLDEETQAAAEDLSYNRNDWNEVGSADIEDLKFEQLNANQQVAAQKLGFEQRSWDCWQNHYFGYLWSELSDEILQPMVVLGWTMQLWDSDDDSELMDKKWTDLTSTQRDAAKSICYFQETWEKTNLESWECPKNHFADLSWEGLQEAGVQAYFDTLGWSEDSWDGTADPPPTEEMHWDELSLEQHVAAMQICFTKSVWESAFSSTPDNSPTPGASPTPGSNPTPDGSEIGPETAVYPDFRFRTWLSLSPAVQDYAKTLSYNEDKWNNLGSALVEKIPFKGLSAEEQHAAVQLGFKDALSWNCYMNHYLGFTWDELEEEGVQAYYVVLGYSDEMWKSSDQPQSKVMWDQLNGAEQTAAQKLCYIKESWDDIPLDKWECSWNHFTGRSWTELKDIQVQHYFIALGWGESSWTSGRNTPATESKHWDDLSADEQAAARAICFEKESWDDPSEFYPILRYKLWDLLENHEQKAAELLMYDKNTWNNPATAQVEKMAFDDMSDVQKNAAGVLQFKEDTWDCWQNHYEAFDWKELEEYGTPYFLSIFGWTESKWNAYVANYDLETINAPVSWTKTWDELSGEEQNAGKAMCYIEQTWDKLDLNDWDCSKNHYDGYTWEKLEEVRVQGYFKTLGWTADSWNGKAPPPNTQSHHWSQLNKAERLAARQLCYSKSVWESYFVEKEGDGKDNMGGIIAAVVICVSFVGLVGALQIWGLQRKSKAKEDDIPHTIPNDVAVQV